MSNRQSRAKKRELKDKALEAKRNEKKNWLTRLRSWFNKKKKPKHRLP
ncbi:hypothetical protein SK355_10280 [Candidatus Fukatsuia symbiotica]|nr:hypothetical protein [Candidatus Fukatsuia symbiotica]MEA9445418.1 hypothetical protein [Candidatus Fukatsuia symbiotica]MEA9445582.1 hypothetical protein [Candidatus Fukatsuia symbiotica]